MEELDTAIQTVQTGVVDSILKILPHLLLCILAFVIPWACLKFRDWVRRVV